MNKSNVKKTAVLVVAFILVAVCAVGGTLAWLQDETDAVVNTFTTAEVDIDLDESTGEEYKMTPGATIAKDPKVTVFAGSEDSYVFVKIDESANLDDFISYTVAEGWTLVDDTTNVYYRTYTSTDSDVEYSVLANDQVTVLDSVTNEQMEELTEGTYPTLTFTAYAVQMNNGDSTFTVAEAWNIAQGLQSDGILVTGGTN